MLIAEEAALEWYNFHDVDAGTVDVEVVNGGREGIYDLAFGRIHEKGNILTGKVLNKELYVQHPDNTVTKYADFEILAMPPPVKRS